MASTSSPMIDEDAFKNGATLNHEANSNQGSSSIDEDDMQRRKHSISSTLHWTSSFLLLGLSIFLIVVAFTGDQKWPLLTLHPIIMGIAVSCNNIKN